MTLSTDPGSARPTSTPHALSWASILGGAAVALAASVTLTLAAAGLGYPLAPSVLSTRTALGAFTPELGAGAILIQVLSSALGGYLAGRLRFAWSDLHDDEAHFRDTAHGLIAWAVYALAAVTLAASVLTPYADLSSPVVATVPLTLAAAERAAHIAAQASLFAAIGLLLSAFVACAAARLGGMAAEANHARLRG